MKKILLFIFLLFPTLTQAGVNRDLTTFFNKLGGAANISRPGAYQDQAAGYYTGGNLFARTQVHHSQLARIQLPGFRAGCGGIDMFTGAFSHISSHELTQAIKAIGSNLGPLVLMLYMDEVTPQMKNLITEFNDLSQRINQSNLNSCELAATTLGAVWPRSEAGKRHLCKMIGTDGKYGGFSDYSAARQGCGAGGKRDGIIESAQNDPRFKSMLGSEFNLAWKAIQENAFLRSDTKLAEFFMSLSGTIVSRKNGEGDLLFQTFHSLAHKDTLFSALLHGGEVKIYRCAKAKDQDQPTIPKDTKCLSITHATIKIAKENALVEQVKKVLTSIQNKIYADTALNEAEKAFLNSTRLPLYQIINVSTAYRRGGSPVDLMDYAELGAVDLLFQYLSEILNLIQESVDHLKRVQVEDGEMSRFQKSLEHARTRVIERRMGTFKQIDQVISIVEKTKLLERSLMNKVGHMAGEGL